jgi:hypothetical protein
MARIASVYHIILFKDDYIKTFKPGLSFSQANRAEIVLQPDGKFKSRLPRFASKAIFILRALTCHKLALVY